MELAWSQPGLQVVNPCHKKAETGPCPLELLVPYGMSGISYVVECS